MVRSFKLLFAAVMLMAVMCAGAAFAADTVSVDLKMTASQRSDLGVVGQTPLPNNEVRLWVTRRVGSNKMTAELMDVKGNGITSKLILYSTQPTPGDTQEDWLSDRSTAPNAPRSGVIDGTSGISYEVIASQITLSADVNAVSGDRATIYVYGGMTDWKDYDQEPTQRITSVVVTDYDLQQQGSTYKDVTPFPTDNISRDISLKQHGGVITSFDVVVLSSDAELILDQIEASDDLRSKVKPGPNVIEKDASGKITDVNKNQDTEHLPHLSVNLADGTVQLIVVSADSQGNFEHGHLSGLDQNDVRVYLRAGETHDGSADEPMVCSLKPQIDQSGTITYLIGEPDMLAALLEYVKTDSRTLFHIDFDDLNTKYGWSIPAYSLNLSFYHRGGGSSGTCAAGSAVFIGLAALALINRRKR